LKGLFNDIFSILIKREKKKFFLLMLFSLLISIADILSLAFLFFTVNFYTPQSAPLNIPLLSAWRIDEYSILPAVLLLIIFITKSFAGYFSSKAQFRYTSDIASRLTKKNLLLYLEGRYEEHVNIDSAVWTRRICFQTLEFAQYVLLGIQQIINESILIIISITALALYNLKLLAIVSFVLLPAVFIILYTTKRTLKETMQNIKAGNELSLQYLNEAIAGFVESNIYGKNDFFINRYAESRFALNRFIADMQVTQVMPNRFFEVFAVLGLFVLMLAIKFNGSESSLTILLLGAFVAAAYKIIPGISKIISLSGQIKTYLFTANELAEQKNINAVRTLSFINKIESIEMQHVQFSYADNIVLNDLSCNIHRNSFVCISGSSGKGKTTLIDILLGFLLPQKGVVLFNNIQMNTNSLKNMWPQIAYVKQTTFLLHDSIFNNITLYTNNVDNKKLTHVLEVTGLSNWINQLPLGIHTIITENGKNISGGQRQRIAIARAFFKNASLIILDEPFNELDEDSELDLLRYLKELSLNGKTVLLVTHNTNSFTFCDNIIYLNEKPK
jgi:ABC-type multidrug transport system fused ATPase/permease subunit